MNNRRGLILSNNQFANSGVGLSAVLTPENITETNKKVYDYILANSTTDHVGTKDWYPCESDDIVITGTFDGIVLTGAKVVNAYCYPGVPYFELEWEGQSVWHYGWLYEDGLLDMGDDS